MNKYKLATVFLIAIMATGMLAFATPLTSADDFSDQFFPPKIEAPPYPPPYIGTINDWLPIKALDVDPLFDTEPWSSNGTTVLPWLPPKLMDVRGPGVGDAARDLEALYMWFEPTDKIYVRLDVRGLLPGFGYGPGCANESLYAMTLSTDLNEGPPIPGSSFGLYDGLFYLGMCAWEYILVFSEAWCLLIGYNGTGPDTVDANIVGATMFPPPGAPNMTMNVDYVNSAIEVCIPREDFTQWWTPNGLKKACINVVSAKPGLIGNPALAPGAAPNGCEDPILHPFDPNSVIRGPGAPGVPPFACPPYAGEEMFQPAANGPDHADIMAPAWVAPVPVAPGWYPVMAQKYVDMSPGAKLEIHESGTGQQNLTKFPDDVVPGVTTFTVDIEITDAINVTGIVLGLQWDPTVLNCTAFSMVTGAGTFMGPAAQWLSMPSVINNTMGYTEPPETWSLTAAATPRTDPDPDPELIATATFLILRETPLPVNSWICFYLTRMKQDLTWAGGIRAQPVEYPLKNMWFEIRAPPPPPPGPPTLRYTQTPAIPPHYVGVQIQFSLCTSTGGSNGTHIVPIENYSLTVWNSTLDILYSYEDSSHLLNFTPAYEDWYTFELDIELDPDFDPQYTQQHPDWMRVATNVTKYVMELPLYGIDCYTEHERLCGYTTDVIGKGHDFPADAYSIDEEVTVYSYVYYNGWPKQSFLVSYEVYDANDTLVLVRNRFTNASGIANMSFRILTVCMDPEYAHGKWHIFQKVYMCEKAYNDTLMFDVGWLVELESVTPVQPIYEYPAHMSFVIEGKNIAYISRYIVWCVVVYDDDDVPIAKKTGGQWVDPGTYCHAMPFRIDVTCLAIPKWFYPGVGHVYANAWFNGLPTECGHPCCPEVSNIVILKAPPTGIDP